MSAATQHPKGGTVQELVCFRLGHAGPYEKWTKLVYIPFAETDAAYKAWLCVNAGEYSYTLRGECRAVSRKPRNVAHWSE